MDVLIVILLIAVIILQIVILSSIKSSRNIQAATASKIGEGLDWIDGGLANSLDNYRGYGE